MIVLRQGKAKTILESSINSAFTAVETYNRPRTSFRIENYIILMIIAWTKLFHAYFQATIGERYFYKEKNGRFKRVDGELEIKLNIVIGTHQRWTFCFLVNVNRYCIIMKTLWLNCLETIIQSIQV